MNYLQLCQRLMSEASIPGVMSTTVGLSGELLRVANWIADAWTEIQTQHEDWTFMRSSYLQGNAFGCKFTTVSGQAVYQLGSAPGTVGVADVGKWDRYSFRNYSTAAGISNEIEMGYITYDQWRDAYMMGALRTSPTRPITIAIGPNFSVNLGPPPLDGYTIEADYWVPAQQFSANDDLPQGLPDRFHIAIVWKALVAYGEYESAAEAISRGERSYARVYSRIEALYAPEITVGSALA